MTRLHRREREVGRLSLAAAGGFLVLVCSAGPAVAMGFHTLTPCRAIDTRSPSGGAPALVAGGTRTFVVVGQCGIPSDAKVLSLTVTVTASTASGLLVLYPGGSPLPPVSTINYSAGQTRANNASIALGPAGSLQVAAFQAGGSVHLIVDVNGYYEAAGCSDIPNVGAVLVSPRPAARYADQVNAVHRALNPSCTVNSACPIGMQANTYRIAFAQRFRELFPDVCAGIQTDAGVLVDEVCIGSKTECQGYHVFVCKAPPAGGCPPGNPDCGCDSGSAAWAPGAVRDTWRLPTAAACLPCPPLGKIEVKQMGVATVREHIRFRLGCGVGFG